jgi:hypothetical protein
MTLVLGLLNPRHDYSRILHDAGSLTLGVAVLIVAALSVVLFTYRHAGRARGRPRRLPHPRRGTSAVLLGVIAAVLLMLTSASQHRIGSLTIVSRGSARHSPSTAAVATHRPSPRRQAHRHRRGTLR